MCFNQAFQITKINIILTKLKTIGLEFDPNLAQWIGMPIAYQKFLGNLSELFLLSFVILYLSLSRVRHKNNNTLLSTLIWV